VGNTQHHRRRPVLADDVRLASFEAHRVRQFAGDNTSAGLALAGGDSHSLEVSPRQRYFVVGVWIARSTAATRAW
jgi:hypothetical protein